LPLLPLDGAYLEPNHYFFACAYQWVQSGISQTKSTLNKRGLDPFRHSVVHSYRRVQTGARQTLSKFSRKRQNSDLNVSAEATLQSSNHFAPTYRRFQEGVSLALSRLRRKTKAECVGKGRRVRYTGDSKAGRTYLII
jgi:hypothetical protein